MRLENPVHGYQGPRVKVQARACLDSQGRPGSDHQLATDPIGAIARSQGRVHRDWARQGTGRSILVPDLDPLLIQHVTFRIQGHNGYPVNPGKQPHASETPGTINGIKQCRLSVYQDRVRRCQVQAAAEVDAGRRGPWKSADDGKRMTHRERSVDDIGQEGPPLIHVTDHRVQVFLGHPVTEMVLQVGIEACLGKLVFQQGANRGEELPPNLGILKEGDELWETPILHRARDAGDQGRKNRVVGIRTGVPFAEDRIQVVRDQLETATAEAAIHAVVVVDAIAEIGLVAVQQDHPGEPFDPLLQVDHRADLVIIGRPGGLVHGFDKGLEVAPVIFTGVGQLGPSVGHVPLGSRVGHGRSIVYTPALLVTVAGRTALLVQVPGIIIREFIRKVLAADRLHVHIRATHGAIASRGIYSVDIKLYTLCIRCGHTAQVHEMHPDELQPGITGIQIQGGLPVPGVITREIDA